MIDSDGDVVSSDGENVALADLHLASSSDEEDRPQRKRRRANNLLQDGPMVIAAVVGAPEKGKHFRAFGTSPPNQN